jgi:hypothetical protein
MFFTLTKDFYNNQRWEGGSFRNELFRNKGLLEALGKLNFFLAKINEKKNYIQYVLT